MIQLSIIIPHYNSSDTLSKLLDSIPKKEEVQTIVIDDRSDKDINKLNSLISNPKYNNVLFLNNDTKNKGAGTCRNIGLDRADGKWVLFADADDFFCSDFYELVKQYINSDNDVVFFTPTSIELDTGNISNRHEKYENIIKNFSKEKNGNSESALRYCFPVPWSKLIKRDFLVVNGIYFDEVRASNDVLFSTKVGYHMDVFEVSQKIIYCVTRSKGTLTTNISSEVFDSRLSVYISYHHYLKSNLDEKELRLFSFHGRGFIVNAIKYRLGLLKILSTVINLKKNNIGIFDTKLLNPIYVFKKIIYHYKNNKMQKKYFAK